MMQGDVATTRVEALVYYSEQTSLYSPYFQQRLVRDDQSGSRT